MGSDRPDRPNLSDAVVLPRGGRLKFGVGLPLPAMRLAEGFLGLSRSAPTTLLQRLTRSKCIVREQKSFSWPRW